MDTLEAITSKLQPATLRALASIEEADVRMSARWLTYANNASHERFLAGFATNSWATVAHLSLSAD